MKQVLQLLLLVSRKSDHQTTKDKTKWTTVNKAKWVSHSTKRWKVDILTAENFRQGQGRLCAITTNEDIQQAGGRTLPRRRASGVPGRIWSWRWQDS